MRPQSETGSNDDDTDTADETQLAVHTVLKVIPPDTQEETLIRIENSTEEDALIHRIQFKPESDFRVESSDITTTDLERYRLDLGLPVLFGRQQLDQARSPRPVRPKIEHADSNCRGEDDDDAYRDLRQRSHRLGICWPTTIGLQLRRTAAHQDCPCAFREFWMTRATPPWMT